LHSETRSHHREERNMNVLFPDDFFSSLFFLLDVRFKNGNDNASGEIESK
jgi:hypothetical protein